MRDPRQLDYSIFGVNGMKDLLGSIIDNWGIKLLIGLLCSANDFFFHPRHEMIEIVFILVLFDTLTGFLKAIKTHTVSSSGFFRAGLKILVYLILLMTGASLDKLDIAPHFFSALTMIVIFLAATESISVLENAADLGFEVPRKLVKLLKFAKDGGNITDLLQKDEKTSAEDKKVVAPKEVAPKEVTPKDN
jgi:toxin secretion/phage lysis holin